MQHPGGGREGGGQTGEQRQGVGEGVETMTQNVAAWSHQGRGGGGGGGGGQTDIRSQVSREGSSRCLSCRHQIRPMTSTSELHHEVQSGIFWIRATSVGGLCAVVVVDGGGGGLARLNQAFKSPIS